MKLCLVTRDYPRSPEEPIVSGSKKNPYYLSQTLAGRGHDVTVLTHGPTEDEWSLEGVTVRQVGQGWYRGFVRAATESVKAARAYREFAEDGESFDVINVHYPAPGFLFANWGTNVDAPLVSTAHGTILPEIRANNDTRTATDRLYRLNALVKSKFDTISWNLSDLVVPAGTYQVTEMKETYGVSPSKLRPVTNGVDTSLYEPDEERRRTTRAELGVAGTNVVLFVGRLVKKKGLQYLVRALGELRQRNPDVTLLVVGGTAATSRFGSRIRRLIDELGLGDRVKILTEVPESRMAAIYNAADVCAVPSINYDPLPTVVFEAMASGKPIVGTNKWGIPQQVGHDRTLVPEKDPRALARGLRTLIEDRSVAEREGRRNRERACRKFDWDDVAAMYEDLYQEVMTNGRK